MILRIVLEILCASAAVALLSGPVSAAGAAAAQGGAASAPSALSPAAEREVHRLLGVLDYIAKDYSGAVEAGAVVSAPEYEEQKTLSADAVSIAHDLTGGDPESVPVVTGPAPKEPLVRRMLELVSRIEAKGPAPEIENLCTQLRREVLARFPVRLVPDRTPDLENGRILYQVNCSLCHGDRGDANTQRARELQPPPLSFLGEKADGGLSPYHAYNVMTFGIPGTAMASFELLPAKDRWDVAFYLLTLRNAKALSAEPKGGDAGRPELSLAELAVLSDAGLRDQLTAMGRSASELGADVAWLRRETTYNPPRRSGSLAGAKEKLRAASTAYAGGQPKEAARLLLDAYLTHVEPSEAALRALDSAAVVRLETAFLDARVAIREGLPAAALAERCQRFHNEVESCEALLASGARSSTFVFTSSFLILLREGVEAVLLLGAMLAMLRKLGQPGAARYVHWGWIAALAAGLVTWAVARTVIVVTSAQRELVEGVVGLAAAAVLAYTSYWILSRAQAKRWMEDLRSHISKAVAEGDAGAIGSAGRFTLFGLSFLAVYREAFETVLFLEAILAEHQQAAALSLVGGLAAGAGALAVVIFLMFRLSKKLPMTAFFNISGALLFVLAVIFAGSGIHALIEGGHLDPRPISFPRVEWLGVFPDQASLAAQAALLALVPLGLWLEWRRTRVPAHASAR